MCDTDFSFFKMLCVRKCDCMRSFGWGIKCDVSEFVCFWNWFIVYNTSKFDLYEQFELEKKCSVNIFQNFMGFQGFLCCWSFKFGIHTPLSNCFFFALGSSSSSCLEYLFLQNSWDLYLYQVIRNKFMVKHLASQCLF